MDMYNTLWKRYYYFKPSSIPSFPQKYRQGTSIQHLEQYNQ